MATMLSTIASYMDGEGFKYSVHDDHITTNFMMDMYEDDESSRSLFIVIRLDEDGEYFKMAAPNLYNYPADGPNLDGVLKTLLGVCWRSKLMKYEYDESDGEIRASVEFALEDAPLTAKQFSRCLNGFVQLIDEYHPAIANAMYSGDNEISLDIAEELAENVRIANTLCKQADIRGAFVPEPRRRIRLEE